MLKKFRNSGIFIILGTFSLVAGLLIYLIFRSGALITVILSKYIQLSYLKKSLYFFDNGFIKYYLPDYLWALSLSCYLQLLFPQNIKSSVLCTCSVLCLGVTYEILQYANFVKGTGDIIDMLLYMLAGLTVNIIILKRSLKK